MGVGPACTDGHLRSRSVPGVDSPERVDGERLVPLAPLIDAYASNRHYADHIRPIWNQLPNRGTWWDAQPKSDGPFLVASGHDLRKIWPRPAILIEHGAGQTYVGGGARQGYAGGPGRGNVVLFVCPNERVAALNKKAYPQARTVVAAPRVEQLTKIVREPEKPAVSFHWDCRVSPEARTAWPHYQTLDLDVLGHGHPRQWGQFRRWWQTKQVEPVESFEDVIRRASAYAVDNSSTLYEAAACGIPTVAMNAPWYRRDVHHGLRFWDLTGRMVDHPDELEEALKDADVVDVSTVYPDLEGSAVRVVEQLT